MGQYDLCQEKLYLQEAGVRKEVSSQSTTNSCSVPAHFQCGCLSLQGWGARARSDELMMAEGSETLVKTLVL